MDFEVLVGVQDPVPAPVPLGRWRRQQVIGDPLAQSHRGDVHCVWTHQQPIIGARKAPLVVGGVFCSLVKEGRASTRVAHGRLDDVVPPSHLCGVRLRDFPEAGPVQRIRLKGKDTNVVAIVVVSSFPVFGLKQGDGRPGIRVFFGFQQEPAVDADVGANVQEDVVTAVVEPGFSFSLFLLLFCSCVVYVVV